MLDKHGNSITDETNIILEVEKNFREQFEQEIAFNESFSSPFLFCLECNKLPEEQQESLFKTYNKRRN